MAENSRENREDRWITVFQSRTASAEIEANTIRALLEASEIDALIVRENVPELPTGRVTVRVLESDARQAEEVLKEARKAGAEQTGEDMD